MSIFGVTLADSLTVAGSCAAFSSLYQLHCRTQPAKGPEWSIRLVTMVHAAVVVAAAYFSCFVLGPWPLAEPGLPTNSFNGAIVGVSLGYFALDYAWCLRFGSEGWLMHLHHWFSLAYLTWGLCSKTSGAEIAGVIFGSELTNPMLQLRWMLKRSGKYDTTLAILNDAVFAATFLSVRMLVGSCFLYRVLVHPRPRLEVKIGGIIIYVISGVFCAKILVFVRRRWMAIKGGRHRVESDAVSDAAAAAATASTSRRENEDKNK